MCVFVCLKPGLKDGSIEISEELNMRRSLSLDVHFLPVCVCVCACLAGMLSYSVAFAYLSYPTIITVG